MKLLGIGDDHFCEDIRFEECCAIHDWVVDLSREEQVDLVLCSGDIYERASTAIERRAVADWIVSQAEVSPIVIAKGNHDRPWELELLRRLRTRHPVIVEEAAGVHHVAGAAIAALAWPDRAAIFAQAGSQAGADGKMRDALQAVLRGLGEELARHDGPRILLAHCMVDGSLTSTGQPLLGLPINVSLADLALARAHLGIFGHIHRAQFWDIDGAPHGYVGSPFRTDFGQLEPKTVSIAEFDGSRLVSLRHVETPCTKMIHVEDEWGLQPDGTGPCWLAAGEPIELVWAEVRFRFRVPADLRESASRAAEKWRDEALRRGAKAVKLEPQVIAERRARAPEIARAVGIREKLEAYWTSTAFDPGARHEELLGKAAQLEEEVREASNG